MIQFWDLWFSWKFITASSPLTKPWEQLSHCRNFSEKSQSNLEATLKKPQSLCCVPSHANFPPCCSNSVKVLPLAWSYPLSAVKIDSVTNQCFDHGWLNYFRKYWRHFCQSQYHLKSIVELAANLKVYQCLQVRSTSLTKLYRIARSWG